MLSLLVSFMLSLLDYKFHVIFVCLIISFMLSLLDYKFHVIFACKFHVIFA